MSGRNVTEGRKEMRRERKMGLTEAMFDLLSQELIQTIAIRKVLDHHFIEKAMDSFQYTPI